MRSRRAWPTRMLPIRPVQLTLLALLVRSILIAVSVSLHPALLAAPPSPIHVALPPSPI